MNSPTLISVSGASKRFVLHKDKSVKERILHFGERNKHTDDFWALRDIDLNIRAGETVGLIGANGSGKSTLLKLVGAIIQPTTGVVKRRGRLAALLELGAGFHPDLTGRENVYLNAAILGMSRAETNRSLDAIIDFSGIEEFIDTQVKFYSSGMYVRLAFAVAVHVDPDLLLVDEVLAVGDEPFQRKCMDKIRSFQQEGRTIVLVSHSADQVGDLCDRAVLLRKGLMVFDGMPASALRQLRAGFEDDRVTEAERRPDDVAPAAAEITAVELLDSAGRPTSSVATGEALVVRLHVQPKTRLDVWMVAVAIETNLGHALFRFNSQTASLDLGPLVRPMTVDFRLPALPLGEGQYAFNVGIGDAAGATIHRLGQAATIAVRGPYVGTGVLGISPEISVAPS
ncbi:MAG: ABC transporter ATP-binding protein [Cellulomonas sp.]